MYGLIGKNKCFDRKVQIIRVENRNFQFIEETPSKFMLAELRLQARNCKFKNLSVYFRLDF